MYLFQFSRKIRDLAVMIIPPINTRLMSLTICTAKIKHLKYHFPLQHKRLEMTEDKRREKLLLSIRIVLANTIHRSLKLRQEVSFLALPEVWLENARVTLVTRII